jgi:hypothetical protein
VLSQGLAGEPAWAGVTEDCKGGAKASGPTDRPTAWSRNIDIISRLDDAEKISALYGRATPPGAISPNGQRSGRVPQPAFIK